MKRLNLILLLALCAVLILSGGHTPSITDRSIVHAIGVDKSESGLRVTLQIFKPEAAGSDTPIDISKANFKTLTADGRNMEECLYKLSGRAGGELFLGHMQLLVLSEDIKLESIEQLVTPLRDDKSIYPGLYLACAENAGEIVSFPIKENAVTAENYRRIIESAAARGSAFSARLIDIDNTLGVRGSLAVPYLSIEGQKGRQSLDVTGSRVLAEHGFSGVVITPAESSYLTLLRDTRTERPLPREAELDGRLIRLTDLKREVSFSETDGSLVCRIRLYARTDDPADLEKAADKLTKIANQYLDTDPARLFEYLRLYHPAFYARSSGRIARLEVSCQK